jgi:hypothetical protein
MAKNRKQRVSDGGEKASRHISYMAALQHLAHGSRELARLMPHHGERGRIAEEIIKSVLTRTLPKRFSVGTGVVFSADGQVSRQTDIVIYDNFYNSPLLSEFGACVFPVETVYATIEVKSELTKQELRKAMDAIMLMRSVGGKRHYVVPGVQIEDGKPRSVLFRQTHTVPPRNYIVAFSQRGLGPEYEDFSTNLRKCLDEDNSHVHGVCVLDRDWFAGRVAFRSPAQLFGSEGDGLLNLYVNILKAQQNFSVHPMDLDAYLPTTDEA